MSLHKFVLTSLGADQVSSAPRFGFPSRCKRGLITLTLSGCRLVAWPLQERRGPLYTCPFAHRVLRWPSTREQSSGLNRGPFEIPRWTDRISARDRRSSRRPH